MVYILRDFNSIIWSYFCTKSFFFTCCLKCIICQSECRYKYVLQLSKKLEVSVHDSLTKLHYAEDEKEKYKKEISDHWAEITRLKMEVFYTFSPLLQNCALYSFFNFIMFIMFFVLVFYVMFFCLLFK